MKKKYFRLSNIFVCPICVCQNTNRTCRPRKWTLLYVHASEAHWLILHRESDWTQDSISWSRYLDIDRYLLSTLRLRLDLGGSTSEPSVTSAEPPHREKEDQCWVLLKLKTKGLYYNIHSQFPLSKMGTATPDPCPACPTKDEIGTGPAKSQFLFLDTVLVYSASDLCKKCVRAAVDLILHSFRSMLRSFIDINHSSGYSVSLPSWVRSLHSWMNALSHIHSHPDSIAYSPLQKRDTTLLHPSSAYTPTSGLNRSLLYTLLLSCSLPCPSPLLTVTM